MKVTDTMVLFWGSPFSQWYKHEMMIAGVKYNTAEQFMMAMKATHFKDEESLEKIMKERDPRKQKLLGKKVKNFDTESWNKVAKGYVRLGNYAKFSDPELKKFILETGNREIVEASPYDRIWGIGLGEDDPDALDKTKWLGTNWLGEVLVSVREQLRNEK